MVCYLLYSAAYISADKILFFGDLAVGTWSDSLNSDSLFFVPKNKDTWCIISNKILQYSINFIYCIKIY